MELFLYVLFYHSVYLINCLPVNETIQDKRKAFENERAELIKQINDAIEDSLSTLQNNNDSDTHEAISYIKQLKEQLDQLIDYDMDDEDIRNNSLAGNNTDTRHVGGRRRDGIDENDRIRELIVKYSSIVGKPDKDGAVLIQSKKKQKRLNNRIEIEKKLAAWMKQREKGKQLIAAYKLKMSPPSRFVTEKCPNFGIDKKRKRPCCRKCCKSSYLGCLK